MENKTRNDVLDLFVPILYGVFALTVAMLVCWSGQYPFGSDTMTHIYRGDLFYQALCRGDLFPAYDPVWYNGWDVLQHVAPLSYYVMALARFAVGADPLDAYLFYVGIIAFFGGMVWYYIGKKKNRVWLGIFMGIFWFVLPNNLQVLFFEGNLARGFCAVILPIYLYNLCEYVQKKNKMHMAGMIASFAAVILTDLEYAIMVAVASWLFVLIFAIIHFRWEEFLYVFAAQVSAVCITGLWSVRALISIKDVDYMEIAGKYFQNILITLNPLERGISTHQYYYFGLSVLLVALLGIFFSKKECMSGFWMGLFLLCMTTTSMFQVISIVPGKNHMLMCQYITIAGGMILYHFMNWDTMRKSLQVVLCALLLLDAVPSLELIYGSMNGVSVEERFDEQNETTLIKQAKEVSGQRIAFLDESVLESMGPYLLTKYKGGKNTSFGSDWNNAATQNNIKQLNRAMTGGFYTYLFDRCVEMGNDTVLIKLSQLNTFDVPIENLDQAAEAAGYTLAGFNEFYRLYDMDIEGAWGTKTQYPAIGIGDKAEYLSLYLPGVREVTSSNLNDYTFEELSQYEMIYLSSFTYDDKKTAEDLILRLSEAGVRVIIQADGIPEDEKEHTRDFLGVYCNDISFSNGYPLLDTVNGVLDCDLFPPGHESWKTVYVNGLTDVYGTVREEELDLAFYGTTKNDNIIVLGLNLVYFYSLTQDEGVGKLISDVTEFSEGNLAKREIVPLEITYENDKITIKSEYDDVNTSLAYLEMFGTDENFDKENNFVYVNKGKTVLKLQSKGVFIGALFTAVGVILSWCLVAFAGRKQYDEITTEEK